MKRLRQAVIGVALVIAAAAVAVAAGYNRRYDMGVDGVVEISNTQANAVWRPTLVALRFEESASRTVEISRSVDGTEYPIARFEAEGSSYIYEFEANYWFKKTQSMRVAVTPASAGTVEVMYE